MSGESIWSSGKICKSDLWRSCFTFGQGWARPHRPTSPWVWKFRSSFSFRACNAERVLLFKAFRSSFCVSVFTNLKDWQVHNFQHGSDCFFFVLYMCAKNKIATFGWMGTNEYVDAFMKSYGPPSGYFGNIREKNWMYLTKNSSRAKEIIWATIRASLRMELSQDFLS